VQGLQRGVRGASDCLVMQSAALELDVVVRSDGAARCVRAAVLGATVPTPGPLRPLPARPSAQPAPALTVPLTRQATCSTQGQSAAAEGWQTADRMQCSSTAQ
jgi:hypothetical protein